MEELIERLKPRTRKKVQILKEEPPVIQEREPTPAKKEILPYERKHISISDQTYREVETQAQDRIAMHVSQLNPGKNYSMGWGKQDILVDDSLARLASIHAYCANEFKDLIKKQ